MYKKEMFIVNATFIAIIKKTSNRFQLEINVSHNVFSFSWPNTIFQKWNEESERKKEHPDKKEKDNNAQINQISYVN